MLRSNSVYFLGFQEVVSQFRYDIYARFELSDDKDNYYKCEVVVEKQNGVFAVISVQNFEKKERTNYVRYDLPWTAANVSSQTYQDVHNWFLTNQVFTEVLTEGNWLSKISFMQSGPHFKSYKILDNVYAILNLYEITLSTNDTFSIHVKLDECYGVNYIGSIAIYENFNHSNISKNLSLQDQKNEYLVQLLSDKVLKNMHNKVRLYQAFMKR